MKYNKKTIWNTMVTGLMTLTLTCSAVLGGAQTVCAAPEERAGVYWTWHRLESLDQLDKLFKDVEGNYTVAGSSGVKNTIPIMIVGVNTGNGSRYVLNAPGEGENPLVSELDSYGTDIALHDSNWPSAQAYSCTPAADMAGFQYSGCTDTVISGDVNPFFLENTAYKQTKYPKNREQEYRYQIHTWKRNGAGDVVPSSRMLWIGAGVSGSDEEYWCSFSNLLFGEVPEVPYYDKTTRAHCTHAWNLEEVKSNGSGTRFRISNYYYGHAYWFPGQHRLAEMKAHLSFHKNGTWLVHAGMVARHNDYDWDDYDFGGKVWDTFDLDYAQDGYADALEIWYGEPGVRTSKLKTVNGELYFSEKEKNASGYASATELESTELKESGTKVLSLPALSVTHLAKGKKLTIDKGCTLILSRNSFFLNDGQIVNNGTIIIQPGAAIGVYKSLSYESGIPGPYPVVGAINGQGEILIRYGGKVFQSYINQSRIESGGTIYAFKDINVGRYKEVGYANVFKGRSGSDSHLPQVDVIGLNTSDMNTCLIMAGSSRYKPG